MHHQPFLPLLALVVSCAGSRPANCPVEAESSSASAPIVAPLVAETQVERQATRTRVLAHRGAVDPSLESPDEETVSIRIDTASPWEEDGRARVVIEIPAGTIAKFEVMEGTNELKLEYKEGRPRLIDFLPYPANYGSVPRTLVDPEHGGDGDWADVIVLGPALERGQTVSARLIGIMKTIDSGEIDHKLIAVAETEHVGFSELRTFTELRERYPQVLSILQIWFESYKGPGKIMVQGFGDETEATTFLNGCIVAFQKRTEAQ